MICPVTYRRQGTDMRIVIIGLGSMGKRRMRLLHEIACKDNIDIELSGVDEREDRRDEAGTQAEELGFEIVTYDSLGAAMAENMADAAVISTSPLSHAGIIRECLEAGLNVFTELNLVTDGYDENIALAKAKGLTLFMSSTPIYRDEMRYITDKVKYMSSGLNYTYHIGQYLPDWHPWESYKDFFIGDKRTNGCREIMAVELPWLSKAFGRIESVNVMSLRQTSLDIDFPDSYNILIKHNSWHMGALTVDVTARPPIRELKIIGEGVYISWDGTPGGLLKYSEDENAMVPVDIYAGIEHREGYNPTIVENMYVNEIRDFLAVLAGDKEAEYSMEKDREILELIDSIESTQSI